MTLEEVTEWMMMALKKEACIYQHDVVNHLVKSNNDQHLKENADGNLVLSTKVISAFRKNSGDDVVWVKPDKYWRYRVAEDEEGREARG